MKQSALSFEICKTVSMARSLECWEHLQDVSEVDGSVWVGNDDDLQSLPVQWRDCNFRILRGQFLSDG